MKRVIGRFLEQCEGLSFVYFVMAMPAFMGLGLLAIDIGRGNNLHYDLQKAVDSLAIAAASELDGERPNPVTGDPGAIVRAQNAFNNLLKNQTRFSDLGLVTVDGASNNVELQFLCDIPDDDDDPMEPTGTCSPFGNTGGNVAKVTTDPLFAKFAWVRAIDANSQPITSLFPVAFFGGSSTVDIAAEAVAGGPASGAGASCGITPLWMCNPFELTDQGADLNGMSQFVPRYIEGTTNRNPYYGALFSLRPDSSGAPFPGNMGFLAVNGTGANALRDALAGGASDTCFENNLAETEPGFVSSSADGYNMRFGIVDGSFKPADMLTFPPSINNRFGHIGRGPGPNPNQCENGDLPPDTDVVDADGDTMIEPADPAEVDGHETLPLLEDNGTVLDFDPPPAGYQQIPNAYIGNAEWDWKKYFQHTHDWADGDISPNSTPSHAQFPTTGTDAWTDANWPSRYDMHRWEIDNRNNNTIGQPSVGGETGVPQCYPGDPSTLPIEPADDARKMTIAVVNCTDFANNGTKPQGRTALPIAFYTDVFAVQPIDRNSGGNKPFLFEIIRTSQGGGGGLLNDNVAEEVVLYR